MKWFASPITRTRTHAITYTRTHTNTHAHLQLVVDTLDYLTALSPTDMSNHVTLLLAGHFTVDVVTGAITLVKSFDRERSDTLILTLEARDLGTPQLSDQALVNIFLTDVNDNAPQIRPRKMNAAVFEVSCVLCLFYFISNFYL